ncbi:MAG: hypothetical protein ABJA57_06000 [Ginsengibacter sp.]
MRYKAVDEHCVNNYLFISIAGCKQQDEERDGEWCVVNGEWCVVNCEW